MAKTYRDLCVAARDGDHAAIRALMRWHGWPQLADEVRRGKPIPPRVKRQVGALVSHIGTEWEADLSRIQPPRRPMSPRPIIED